MSETIALGCDSMIPLEGGHSLLTTQPQAGCFIRKIFCPIYGERYEVSIGAALEICPACQADITIKQQ